MSHRSTETSFAQVIWQACLTQPRIAAIWPYDITDCQVMPSSADRPSA